MNLEDAIKHCEEVAEGQEEDISKWEYTLSEYRKRECVEQTTIPKCEKALNRCKQCASEHRQLAEWLRDYKRLKEQEPIVTSTNNSGEMIYPQVEGITPTVVEPSGDCISRQAVQDYIAKYLSQYLYNDVREAVEVIDEYIGELPSVKPQTGHWIIMGNRYIKCSECGHITKTESPDIYHFCMVCGARMSENPTSSKPEISSYYGLKSYVRERSDKK